VAPKPQRPIPDLSHSYHHGLSPDYQIEHFHPPPPPRPAATAQPELRSFAVPSFYSNAVQATILQSRNNPQPSLLVNTAPSPPPLKDWPRADVMSKPLSRQTSQARTHHLQLSLPTSPQGGPSRPAGPRRKRTSSGDMLTRPPPLDLSNISSFNRT
jgi:hypothetical protein